MKFPRTQSPRGDAHTHALELLDEARDEQQRLNDVRAAAEGGPAEMHTANEADLGARQVSAREAWAKWAAAEE